MSTRGRAFALGGSTVVASPATACANQAVPDQVVPEIEVGEGAPRHRHAGRRLSGLWRGLHRRPAGEDPALEIEAINTKGSTENVPMLEAGTLDIALVQGEVVHEALAGIGRPPAISRIVTAMYPTAGLFVVRADSPYRVHRRFKGKPIAWGAAGSGLVILGRYAMDGLGLDPAQYFQPVYLERAGDGPAMVLDGPGHRAVGRRAGWPGFRPSRRARAGARSSCAESRGDGRGTLTRYRS